MAKELKLRPSAAALSESLRDIGYSLETAIADIIDNSIAAESTVVNIFCTFVKSELIFAIVDNGIGMNQDTLINSMKHGAQSPKEKRCPKDLGRFGLGLKTASFSQCRELSVVSAQNTAKSCAQWDLDLVDREDEWLLKILDQDEIKELPFTNLLEDSGTLVLWRNLDRLTEELTGKRREELINDKLEIVERHLSLVFHRYLSGEISNYTKIELTVNGHKLSPFDPFCRKNKATQVLPDEKIKVDNEYVTIQPYILPHHSKLSNEEYHFYQSRSDFISNQGAYIYRNGRLMSWGDWFRLVPKGEATKLARVQIDFPNSLDESWTIDIKKSRAKPPKVVRERMKQIISKITFGSTRIHKKRGQKLVDENPESVWDRYADHCGIQYQINNDFFLIKKLQSQLNEQSKKEFSLLLDSIANSLPLEMIYSDYSTAPILMSNSDLQTDQAIEQLEKLFEILEGDQLSPQNFKDLADATMLFHNKEEFLDNFIKEKWNE